MLDGSHFFECQCGSDEHVLRFTLAYSDPEDGPVIYTSVYLRQYRNFFQRAWVALKYLFGYKCKYGHWDCTEIRPDDVERLRDICNEFLTKGKENDIQRNASQTSSNNN